MKRWWPVLGLVALFVGLSWWFGSHPRAQKDLQQRPSTFFTDPSGSRALWLSWRRLFGEGRVLQLCEPFHQLEGAPGLLVVAGPIRPLGRVELTALEEWLQGGGRLLLASSDGWPLEDHRAGNLLARYGVHLKPGNGEPELLSLDRPAGQKWLTVPDPGWKGERFRSLARAGSRDLAIEIEVGKGRIWALSDPGFYSNGRLGKADNGLWLTDLLGSLGQNRSLVYFDEYHLGFGDRRSLRVVARDFLLSPWGWCFVQWIGVGLVYLLWYRSRQGRSVAELAPLARDAMTLLRVRSGLLRSARAHELACQQIFHRLLHQLRDSAGRPAADLEQLAQRFEATGRTALAARVRRCSTVSNPLEAARLAWEIREEVTHDRR